METVRMKPEYSFDRVEGYSLLAAEWVTDDTYSVDIKRKGISGRIWVERYYYRDPDEWQSFDPDNPPAVPTGKVYWLQLGVKNTSQQAFTPKGSITITAPDGTTSSEDVTLPLSLNPGQTGYSETFSITLNQEGAYNLKAVLKTDTGRVVDTWAGVVVYSGKRKLVDTTKLLDFTPISGWYWDKWDVKNEKDPYIDVKHEYSRRIARGNETKPFATCSAYSTLSSSDGRKVFDHLCLTPPPVEGPIESGFMADESKLFYDSGHYLAWLVFRRENLIGWIQGSTESDRERAIGAAKTYASKTDDVMKNYV